MQLNGIVPCLIVFLLHMGAMCQAAVSPAADNIKTLNEAIAGWEENKCIFPDVPWYKPIDDPLIDQKAKLEPCRELESHIDSGFDSVAKFQNKLCQLLYSLSTRLCVAKNLRDFVTSYLNPDALKGISPFNKDDVCSFVQNQSQNGYYALMLNTTLCQQSCGEPEHFKDICELYGTILYQHQRYYKIVTEKGKMTPPATTADANKLQPPVTVINSTPQPLVTANDSKLQPAATSDDSTPQPPVTANDSKPTPAATSDDNKPQPTTNDTDTGSVTAGNVMSSENNDAENKNHETSTSFEGSTLKSVSQEQELSVNTEKVIPSSQKTHQPPSQGPPNENEAATSSRPEEPEDDFINGATTPPVVNDVATPPMASTSLEDEETSAVTSTSTLFISPSKLIILPSTKPEEAVNPVTATTTASSKNNDSPSADGYEFAEDGDNENSKEPAVNEDEGIEEISDDNAVVKEDKKPADKKKDQLQHIVKEDEDESPGSGHFLAYFLTAVVICISGYVIYHNKQKILAFVIEGRNSGRAGRQRSKDVKYTQLKSNVEEVLPSLEQSATSKNFVY
jgi:hypothetical protein